MGGWPLEIGKMAMYMTFPVALFHFFNQPEYFEGWVTQTKRELYPPEHKSNRKEIEKVIREVRAKHDERVLKALEEMESNK